MLNDQDREEIRRIIREELSAIEEQRENELERIHQEAIHACFDTYGDGEL